MKLPQRGLLLICVVIGFWVLLTIFKVHIDIEFVDNNVLTKDTKKQPHNQLYSDIQKREDVKAVPPEKEELLPPYTGKRGERPIYVPWSDYQEKYDKDKETELHDKYRFNKYLSDRLPLNRDVEDTRPSSCSRQRYPRNMGKVSVVLIYYNEAVAVVFRTIYSVINRSPSHLLYEFVLYDDGSVWEESIGAMEAEANKITAVPVRYIRNTTRGGLMRARTAAAKYATGDIMVYLDSHCEVLPGWLEPLIEPIYRDHTAVTCPVIDTIEWDTMKLISGRAPMSAIGSFNILLNYNWYPIPEAENKRRKAEHGRDWAISPIRSPAMAGGLFAINRQYFHDLGSYDTQMNVWGGENTEISIRIWTCGGSLLFTPCSKVGHIFRHGYPYDFQGDHFDTVLFNYKRVAKVWLDEDEEFYYKLRPMARNKDVGDVSERLQKRKELQCKPYNWYVDQIAPNLVTERNLAHYGQLRNHYHDSYCVDNLGNENKGHGLSVGTYPCHPAEGTIDNQFIMLTVEGIFRTIDRCLELNSRNTAAMNHCYDIDKTRFRWEYNLQDRTLKHVSTGLCLDSGDKPMATSLAAKSCDNSTRQKWTFTHNK